MEERQGVRVVGEVVIGFYQDKQLHLCKGGI